MENDRPFDDLDLSRPVFIVGGSRTGSEMLKTMLSASDEIDFVDELFLLCPRWLHKDLMTNIREHVGRLEMQESPDKLLEFLYSGIPYGWFWSVVEQQLDVDQLRARLTDTGLDDRVLFESIMAVHARMRNKTGIGAKFPVHYSHTGKLLEWFPDCRLIHTTRNPKDVYASQAAKHSSTEQSRFERSFSRLQQFVHINIQTAWTARVHKQLRKIPNYRLVRYEDLVSRPEETSRMICEFLDVPFVEQMLDPYQYGSSFGNIGKKHGIETSALGRWRSSISPLSARVMDFLHRQAYRDLGYESPHE